ncbi:MAG: ABC transporter ATP-binding protein [Peptococcaceae bacterium]|nr:ABC transporter ATP-binding protein [Peptococcaceae bacterium]
MSAEPLLRVEDLRVRFNTLSGYSDAVNGISFSLNKNEILGIVGESGSGKSVSSLAVMGLLPERNAAAEGRIFFGGRDLLRLPERELRGLRGKEIAMIFQEPMNSLNPLRTLGWQIMENLLRHQRMTRRQARRRAIELMALTGIPGPEERLRQFPFQLSGGMCQRVMIAMALACGPQLLIADEPTTALDVTVQAQILELMRELSRELGASIILITHDLGVVSEMCDQIIVMYAGQIVEQAARSVLFARPRHPYTLGLLAAIPRIGGGRQPLRAIPGAVPAPGEMPPGCPFHPRCAQARDICGQNAPPLAELGPGHGARCWLYAGAGACEESGEDAGKGVGEGAEMGAGENADE